MIQHTQVRAPPSGVFGARGQAAKAPAWADIYYDIIHYQYDVYIYIYAYTCICEYTYIYIYIYIYTHIHICICT